MPEYRTSKEDYALSRPVERLGKLKLWFIVLLLVGIATLLALLLFIASTSDAALSWSWAQESAQSQSPSDRVEPHGPLLKNTIMSGIFSILGLVYLSAIYKLFFAKNQNHIDIATDLVKTLTGFFVGAATGFLG